MESGSTVIHNGEREKKYDVYVEEYVLSYLKREADSLELSEIYFYGLRKDEGKTFFVYGAGRGRGITAFAQYEPLEELICRLTQAGPVFMVREADGECRVTGFQVFYENNEAMQSYLIEWTGSANRRRETAEDRGKKAAELPAAIPPEGTKKRVSHGAMSVQLCLILVVLVAIVISSTDSYDKMEELNRSAREVFFAIENQEAEETADDLSGQETEIVVERDPMAGKTPEDAGGIQETGEPEAGSAGAQEPSGQEAEAGSAGAQEPSGQEAEAGSADALGQAGQNAETAKTEEAPEEGLLENVPNEAPEEKTEDSAKAEEKKEEGQEAVEPDEEENEEALSRSVTRYYEVEQGDTLYTISQKIYGDISRVEKICELNQITDPDRIRSGQRIILP